MQQFHGEDDKGVEYTFVYMEDYDIVLVWKPDSLKRPAYGIKVTRRGQGVYLQCECLGFTYNQHCRHCDFSREEFNFNRTVVPRAWINKVNDEYIREWLERSMWSFRWKPTK